jgi:hypothetical protein
MEQSHVDLIRVSKEDIDQEVALLKLEGKTNVSRSIIYRRLSRAESIFDEVPVGATLLWQDQPITDPHVTETLVDWAMHQTSSIAEVIFDFLESPTEDQVDAVLEKLHSLGAVLEASKPAPKEIPLTQIVLEALSIRPHYKEELYALARSIQPSQRPEAAIRQMLRRLKRQGVVNVEGDLVFLLVTEE